MQDQLTGGNTNLQQQQGNLQQNTPNLQQSGSSTDTLNTSSLLSEQAQTNQLHVTTTTSTAPSTVQADVAASGNDLAWGWLLMIPVVIIVLLIALWPRRFTEPVALIESEQPEVPQPTSPTKKTTKAKKKSKARKKSGRR